MEAKALQEADKLSFVHDLYDYCSRATNADVRRQFAEKMGVAEISFRNKMYRDAGFKGQELDMVLSLYSQVLGTDDFNAQLQIFLTNASDGDRRTKEAAKDRAIAELADRNENMALSKILVS